MNPRLVAFRPGADGHPTLLITKGCSKFEDGSNSIESQNRVARDFGQREYPGKSIEEVVERGKSDSIASATRASSRYASAVRSAATLRFMKPLLVKPGVIIIAG